MNRAIVMFLLPVLLLGELFNFHGSVGIEAEFFPVPSPDEDGRPIYRFMFDPEWKIFGMPLSINTLISSQESSLRQAINKYRILLQPSKLIKGVAKAPNFVFSISGVEIGTSYPEYSDYTFKGVPVNGLSIKFNPWIFFLAGAGGRMKRAVAGSDTTDGTYTRNALGLKVGFGKEKGGHFFVNFLHTWDDSGSIPDFYKAYGDSDTTLVLSPEENFVLGAEIQIFSEGSPFYIKTEGAVSQHTWDRTIKQEYVEEFPEWISSNFHPNISTSFDYAYTVVSGLGFGSTSLSFGYRYVGPGFTTSGNPQLRKDRRGFDIQLNTGFSNLLTFMFAMNNEYNNTAGITTTTRFRTFTFQAGVFIPHLPYINILYSPYRETDLESGGERGYDLLTISTGMFFRVASLNNSVNLSYSNNAYSDTTTPYVSNGIQLSLSMGFPSAVNLNISTGYQRCTYTDSVSSMKNLDISVDFPISMFENSAGITFDTGDESTTTIYGDTELDAGVIGSFRFRTEFSSNHNSKGDYNEMYLKLTYSKKW